jgi:hypothetical protein
MTTYDNAIKEAREALQAASAMLPYDGKLNAMAHKQIESAKSEIKNRDYPLGQSIDFVDRR